MKKKSMTILSSFTIINILSMINNKSKTGFVELSVFSIKARRFVKLHSGSSRTAWNETLQVIPTWLMVIQTFQAIPAWLPPLKVSGYIYKILVVLHIHAHHRHPYPGSGLH
jgi:hypothetical protein